ncbi:hypothetical protein BKA70DRAFT_791487 [Coprinopsis sp. MPI-PUGE-AT-0042]|nr:hypothetical protein BKA70DRAFT_791487 [Coprinopsis sp. MPI-PUGE-AT-0042]
MSMSSTAERDRDAQDVTDKLPAELWLKIFGLVIHIPGSSETSNVGTILSFVRENESFRPLKPRDRRPICLVCKKWDQLMELVDDHVSLHSLKRVISLSQRVDSIQGLAGARVPNLATQRIDITIDTDFIAAIESQDALTHLINILSSCPSLATLSFHAARVGDYHKGAMVGEILEMVLAVCPGLKRLELCIPNDWAPLLFPLSKHHSGTLQVLRISSPFLVFYHPMRLPRLHTLIIQNGLSGPPDLKTWDELSRAHMDLPSLKASAILMTPDNTEFPNDLHYFEAPSHAETSIRCSHLGH